MKDFQVAGPVNPADSDLQEEMDLQQREDENNVERWKRVARLAVLTSTEHRWNQVHIYEISLIEIFHDIKKSKLSVTHNFIGRNKRN